MAKRPIRIMLCFAAALLAAACASTSIKNAWYDSSYSGGAFRKILVVGLHEDIPVSRSFEDVFVARLNATGSSAIPGYLSIPPDARPGDPVWNAAVEAAGADAMLSLRLLRVDTKTQVMTTMAPAPMMWGPYYGGWGSAMVYAPQVMQYEVATVETSLWDVRTRRVVWAATTDTFNPGSVQQEAPGFADLIIGQLAQRGLIATR